MSIRRLGPNELEAWRGLWLDGLRCAPEAFLLTEAEVLAQSDAQLLARLQTDQIWGAFREDVLVGMAVLRRGGVTRLHHTGDIGPLYVHPSAQGQGRARALLAALIVAARDIGLLQIELCVDARNAPAIALYRSSGFVEFGRRPRSVIIDGVPRDDLLMMCVLDAA